MKLDFNENLYNNNKMKTQPRFLLISLALVSLLLVCVSILYLCKKEHTYKPHPIRPGNFPQILIAPAGAVSLDHSETSIPKQSPFAYTLTFIANDPYPSKDTCNFIETHLKSNGFQRLNYHLMNPDVPSEFPNVMLYQFYQKTGKLDESTKEKCRSPRPEGGNQPIRWMEDWLNKNNEHVCIDGGYIPLTDEEFPPAIEDKMDLNKLSISMSFFTADSWVRPYILKYKELHPEEFSGNVK